jgi:hypothetical protein
MTDGGPCSGRLRHDLGQGRSRSCPAGDRHHAAERGAGLRRDPRRQGQLRGRPGGSRRGGRDHGRPRQRRAPQPGRARPGRQVHGAAGRRPVPRPRLRPAHGAEHAPDRADHQPGRPRGVRGQRPDRLPARQGAARRRRLDHRPARRHQDAGCAAFRGRGERRPRLRQAGRPDTQRGHPPRARLRGPARHRGPLQAGARAGQLHADDPLLRRVARGPRQRRRAAPQPGPRPGAQPRGDPAVLRRARHGAAGACLPERVAAGHPAERVRAGQHAHALRGRPHVISRGDDFSRGWTALVRPDVQVLRYSPEVPCPRRGGGRAPGPGARQRGRRRRRPRPPR